MIFNNQHYAEPGKLEQNIFGIHNANDFNRLALQIFSFQYYQNPVYKRYCDHLKVNPHNCKDISCIPFLPIDFFKTQTILTGGKEYEWAFNSSGTAGMERSSHYIKKPELYKKSYEYTFRIFYGDPEDYCIMALLPGYWENKHSSLIHMVRGLIDGSGHPESGFYLDNLEELKDKLIKLDREGVKVLLLGVSFALLDMAEQYPVQLENTIVMETGGMKGRRREITRDELHNRLKKGLSVKQIHSEYGMAELLSQAYSKGEGKFQTPPWMKVFIRDAYDPFELNAKEPEFLLPKSGGINIIDLANIYSCAFIETRDIGRQHPDGSFEVQGRFDYSDIRGCNLMVI